MFAHLVLAAVLLQGTLTSDTAKKNHELTPYIGMFIPYGLTKQERNALGLLTREERQYPTGATGLRFSKWFSGTLGIESSLAFVPGMVAITTYLDSRVRDESSPIAMYNLLLSTPFASAIEQWKFVFSTGAGVVYNGRSKKAEPSYVVGISPRIVNGKTVIRLDFESIFSKSLVSMYTGFVFSVGIGLKF